MYDITCVPKRYFPVKLTAKDDEGKLHTTVVEVEPPRLRTLREMFDVVEQSQSMQDNGGITENIMTALRDSIKTMLSKNKAGYKVPDEYVEAMDIDQMEGLFTAYFSWIAETKKEKN